MSENSKIEWTDATWNPVRGCARVSPGCTNCYAERVAMRFRGTGQPYEGLVRVTSQGPKWEGNVQLIHEKLEEPMSWRRPRRVFVNSMSDLFHEDVPFEYIDKVFAIMCRAREHTFQVLTKRADRMLEYMSDPHRHGWVLAASHSNEIRIAAMEWCQWPAPNVWLGVSIEDQMRADERITKLLMTPARIRFLSMEPLLGPVDLQPWFDPTGMCCGQEMQSCEDCPADAEWIHGPTTEYAEDGYSSPSIDWVIVGGESGPGARPMNPDWARSLRDQCAHAGVPFFFKQFGEWAPAPEINDASGGMFHRFDDETWVQRLGKKIAGRLLDGRTHDEFPRGAQ
ncbi:DUF5131 family protein [Paraburkholderia sp. EG286B]|uniref:DUF5131 family protein n=1 Tax=Paraburkholderia sp. EG286B TaxID=3237011 RepID=UPI0034D35B55